MLRMLYTLQVKVKHFVVHKFSENCILLTLQCNDINIVINSIVFKTHQLSRKVSICNLECCSYEYVIDDLNLVVPQVVAKQKEMPSVTYRKITYDFFRKKN